VIALNPSLVAIPAAKASRFCRFTDGRPIRDVDELLLGRTNLLPKRRRQNNRSSDPVRGSAGVQSRRVIAC
jgi:hypothetical protein